MEILVQFHSRFETAEPRPLAAFTRQVLKEVAAELPVPPGAEISVTYVGDEEMRRLNRHYRGKDRPTDVLSFSQQEGAPQTQDGAPDGPPCLLGDIVISVDTAARQAQERGGTLRSEIGALLVHGALHLLGHDHVVQAGDAAARRAAREMRALEERIRERLVRGLIL